jgi:serine/threonine-protein kinase
LALIPGSRLGAYEIVSLLGSGGMGEVYRAHDLQLNRNVALKILPDTFASDPERLARFGREAQVLASLNHPNIAQIYAIETSGSTRALVMELVEGETLADRVARGRIPIDEALPIARQIAEALEAAHEQGIIHRDLKPANIKLRPDGTVKVLDFGLAKLAEPGAASASRPVSPLTQSPTITSPAMVTGVGVLLGTAAYMSPEQARGKTADKRSDIWAFGCLLYEMVTGRRAFEGEDVSETLAAVLRDQPNWHVLPSAVSGQIELLMRRCLERDRRGRIGDMSTVRFLLTEALPAAAGSAARGELRRRILWTTIMVGVGAGLAAMAIKALVRFPGPTALPLIRFAIVPPATQPIAFQGGDRDITVSPEGTHIVYRAGIGTQTQLMIRALNDLDAQPLVGTGNSRCPFFSADGRSVAFFVGSDLKRVSLTGGTPVTITDRAGGPRGGTWSPDDTIIFATADASTGLLSVRAGGGEVKELTKPDAAHGEVDHLFPAVLPGGHAVLFTIFGQAGSASENGQIAVLDLTTGQQKTLIRGGSQAEFVEPGYLVYAAAGTIRAVRFTPARLEVVGESVPVFEHVMTFRNTGASEFAASRNGSIVYAPASAAQAGFLRSLAWVTRQGREEAILAPRRPYAIPRISPDGTRAALDIRDADNDIWIWDFGRHTLTPMTFNPTVDQSPVWAPDGQRLFWSRESPNPNLMVQAADGTGLPERLTDTKGSGGGQFPTSISKDGKHLLLIQNVARAGQDIAMLPVGGPAVGAGATLRSPELLIHTPASELNPEVSPDGHWLAYQSDKSGRFEIYVSSFPDVIAGGRNSSRVVAQRT